MGLRDVFTRILGEYAASREEDFTGHPLAAYIRSSARDEVAAVVGEGFFIKGSAGLNDWAETPWIAVMDRFVTTTTQKGFYVVYLFNVEERFVYLSINQGVTAVKEEFGSGQTQRDILEARAAVMRKRFDRSDNLPVEVIELSEATQLSKSYQWGHVTGARYDARNLPNDETLLRDLQTAIRAYRKLIERNGFILEEEISAGSTQVEERRRLRMHERVERVAADPKKIKKLKGFDCEVCGFNFEEVYGELGREFIEAHHLVPIGTLDAGLSRSVDLVQDFAVLCANCHRMAHRLEDPSDLATLKSYLTRSSWT